MQKGNSKINNTAIYAHVVYMFHERQNNILTTQLCWARIFYNLLHSQF